MSARPWLKFYPADWRQDASLRLVSLSARGLWVEMLALMHEATPYGHLLVVGRCPTSDELARLTGASPEQITELLGELRSAGVFSETRRGVIYSRRMVRDEKRSIEGRKNVRKRADRKPAQDADISAKKSRPTRVPNTPPSTKRPEARGQNEEDNPLRSRAPAARSPDNGAEFVAENSPNDFALTAPEPDPPPAKPKPHHCPNDWQPTADDRAMALGLGLTDEEINDETAEFSGYWSSRRDQKAKRPGWSATWRTHIRSRATRLGAHRRNGAGGAPTRQHGAASGGRTTSIASAAVRLLDQHQDREPLSEGGWDADGSGRSDCDAEPSRHGVYRVIG